MKAFQCKKAPPCLTLRVLARLLSYPDAELRAHLPSCARRCTRAALLRPARLAELDALIDSLRARARWTPRPTTCELFDRGRRTALHLFEHVHGDSRDRGPAMIDLAQTYEKAGLYLAEGELPDHLPVVLEFASTQPPREARAFLGEIAHILQRHLQRAAARESRYASVLAALLELAGEKAAGGADAGRARARRELGRARRPSMAAPPGPGPPRASRSRSRSSRRRAPQGVHPAREPA
jgi:nitrate reductase delta subunit